tara:strand:+ start:1 stop:1467 length:1467 start_codon:yes stop_codon:yes gene_type:complete
MSGMASPLGTNLAGVTYYATQIPFLDIFKTSMPWISGDNSTWDNKQPLDLDSNSNVRSLLPGQIARTLMFRGGDRVFPTGRYIIRYEGIGTMTITGGATRVNELSQPGRDVIDVESSISLYITQTNPSNYLRNIKIVREEYEDLLIDGSTYWDPLFLASLDTVSTLRFMDWGRTNNSLASQWQDRTKVSDSRWSMDKGVPYEVMIDLANTLHLDPWICVPHLATNDFVLSLAELTRDLLSPSLNLYVEYSNEVWNSMFQQSRDCQAQGLALGLGTSPFQARLNYQSRRSVEIFELFEAAYGSNHRLIRVISSQSANPWVSEQLLSFEDTSLVCDALAIAPYFGPLVTGANSQDILDMDFDELIEHVKLVELPKAAVSMKESFGVAEGHGVDLIAYEGGQHLVGVGIHVNNDVLTSSLIAVNKDSSMEGIYSEYLDLWRENGGKLFVHFLDCESYSRWGSWGAREYQGQSNAPKANALEDFALANPKWW